jgi:hypothetical protein
MGLDSMALTLRVTVLVCLSCGLSYAENWTGALVDSKCYEFRERNVNPTDTMTYVDRDTRQEILYCSANAKTKTFAIVLREGPSFRLDAPGNAEAAQLVRSAGKRSLLIVVVTGAHSKSTIQVDSISIAP